MIAARGEPVGRKANRSEKTGLKEWIGRLTEEFSNSGFSMILVETGVMEMKSVCCLGGRFLNVFVGQLVDVSGKDGHKQLNSSTQASM